VEMTEIVRAAHSDWMRCASRKLEGERLAGSGVGRRMGTSLPNAGASYLFVPLVVILPVASVGYNASGDHAIECNFSELQAPDDLFQSTLVVSDFALHSFIDGAPL